MQTDYIQNREVGYDLYIEAKEEEKKDDDYEEKLDKSIESSD